MTSLLMILFLTSWQLVTGFGLLTLFKIRLKPPFFLALSILMGIAIFSLVPFILQLFSIRITAFSVFVSIGISTILLNIRCYYGYKAFAQILQTSRFRVQLYELPFLAVIAFTVLVSVWRCYYFPPTPMDALSGAEVVAEYTIRENTMINSAFEVARNGNSLKPPYLTCLQIIYKFAGVPFGQIWLSNVFICFVVILYHILNMTLHRLLSGMLIILFLAIPELYAYTFMMLYDYSNSVYFFLSVYFLITYFDNRQSNYLAFAGLLTGIATYIRPETPVLAGLMIPSIVWHHVHAKSGFRKIMTDSFVFLSPSIAIYLFSVTLYINVYLPLNYSVAEQINPQWFNIFALFKHFLKTNSSIIFSNTGIVHYGYFIFIFLLFLLLELIVRRKTNRIARNYLYAILIVYLAFPALSHLLPGLSIENSVKRAYFKLFPFMLLYLGQNNLLDRLSQRIIRWELKFAGGSHQNLPLN